MSCPRSCSRAGPANFSLPSRPRSPALLTAAPQQPRRWMSRPVARAEATAASSVGGREPAAAASGSMLAAAGPSTSRPDYAAIDSQPLNRVVYSLFRRKMVDSVGTDSSMDGYDAIVDLTRRLNAMHGSARGTQLATRAILNSLFPSWLPGAFAVMFARPLPELSCRLNAWATWLTCQWLMGECEINDVAIDGGRVGTGHGVLVKRCRYLEESGCASVCINSCKVPTQEFFARDMGLPLTMKPNYEDFSCQFSFGLTPPPEATDEAFATPCFAQCPTARAWAARCPKVVPAAASGDS